LTRGDLLDGAVGPKPRVRLWISTVGILLTACASGQIRDGAYVNAAKDFAVGLPPAGWSVEVGSNPDLLLRHASRHAGISVHATCDGIPADGSLAILSRHLFFGIRGKEILEPGHTTAVPADAEEVVLRGELDSRELVLHGYTLKGPGCVYDLVLFAAPEDYRAVNGEFEAMVRSFRRSAHD